MMRRRSALAGVVSLLSAVFVAGRRGFAAQPVEDKDLVAKAQAQGTVSIYIAMTAEDVQKLVNRFDADYPAMKLQALRFESDQIPAKVTIEQRSGHYDVAVDRARASHRSAQAQRVPGGAPHPRGPRLPAGLCRPRRLLARRLYEHRRFGL